MFDIFTDNTAVSVGLDHTTICAKNESDHRSAIVANFDYVQNNLGAVGAKSDRGRR